jgi:hypothetical protein
LGQRLVAQKPECEYTGEWFTYGWFGISGISAAFVGSNFRVAWEGVTVQVKLKPKHNVGLSLFRTLIVSVIYIVM